MYTCSSLGTWELLLASVGPVLTPVLPLALAACLAGMAMFYSCNLASTSGETGLDCDFAFALLLDFDFGFALCLCLRMDNLCWINTGCTRVSVTRVGRFRTRPRSTTTLIQPGIY